MGTRISWRNPLTARRCDGKRGYMRESTANRQALKAQRKTGDPILEYRCVDCGMWHLGHYKPGTYDEMQLKKSPSFASPCRKIGSTYVIGARGTEASMDAP